MTVYPAHEINAFATAMNRYHALVAVSNGLLQQRIATLESVPDSRR